MKRFLIVLVFLFLIGIARAEFGCTQINCTYFDVNVSGARKWNCLYQNCTERPHWIEENIYHNYTINNCSTTDFYGNITRIMENYTSMVSRTMNVSNQLFDCKMSKDNFKKQSDECDIKLNDKQKYIDNDCFDKDLVNARYNQYEGNITITQNQVSQEQFYGWLKLGAGILVASGGIWFFKLRTPSIRKSDVEPVLGETGFDPRAIDMDSKLKDMEQKRKEDEEKRQKERREDFEKMKELLEKQSRPKERPRKKRPRPEDEEEFEEVD